MSQISGKLGQYEMTWLEQPRGPRGKARVQLRAKGFEEIVEMSWRRDEEGLWIEFADRMVGYDFQVQVDDEGRREIALSQRIGQAEFHRLVFLRAGEEDVNASAGKKKGLKIKAQMPGKIVRVLVQPGQEVQKDQPVLVMEAMKMENELRASAAGRVQLVQVQEGQNVETGALLMALE